MPTIVTRTPSPELLAERRRTGIDLFDERWNGEWHLNAAPSPPHQQIVFDIVSVLRTTWQPRTGGYAMFDLNASTAERWDNDFRVPDVCVLRAPPSGGAWVTPFVIFEVLSQGDETMKKLPFYAELGVEAVVVVDAETKAVRALRLESGAYVDVRPAPDGWTPVTPLGMEMRTTSEAAEHVLEMRVIGEPATTARS